MSARNRPRRRSSSIEALRLEGLVVERRLTRVEATRYLVIDFNDGSISIYKKPPPKDEFSANGKHSRSVPSQFLSGMSATLSRSKSDEGGSEGKPHLTCDNLAHISRKSRHFTGGAWDPKFTVPASVDWQIRDVENDETMFYLVLPANFKKKDADAEVYSVSRSSKKVSYTSMRDLGASGRGTMDPIKEGAINWRTSLDSPARSVKKSNESDDASVSSTRSGSGLFSKKIKRGHSFEQEVVYMFRVLLDGNEKFIWLQAAAELGRLSNEGSISLVSTTFDVTKKMFVLPNVLGAGRSNLTALRYAEWARLIDQKKNVSKFRFDVHDVGKVREPQDTEGDPNAMEESGRYNSTHLVKVIPTYAYRNRRMTEKDLYYEMTTTSEKWEDFRRETVGDREEETIGSLHVEVLACHGLPKLDKLSSTDAVCYFVCGPYAFASDVIDGFLSPVWPSKSRRACIFPIFQAYQKLFVGVFDDDGPTAHDDFAGRVVIDVARLRPNSVYDIFLPLRLYQNAHVQKPRGVIRLRMRVEWDNERKALLSYLKLPKKTKELGNAVTLNCVDYKAFRNVVLTVQGKDVPGRYKQLVQKGLLREMKLYKMIIQTTMKEKMMDIVLYMSPSTSLCIFVAWMHCVYSNSMAHVPMYFVASIIALLVRNYFKYGAKSEEFNFGFTPITISEIFRVLLYGGPNTKYIKSIKVTRKSDLAKKMKGSQDELDGNDEAISQLSIFDGGAGFRMDGDHMEFPFSESGRYCKKTLTEACKSATAMFDDDVEEDEDSKTSRAFSSLRRKAKKSTQAIRLPKALREDDEDEDDDEFGEMVKSSIPPNESFQETLSGQNSGQNNGQEGHSSAEQATAIQDKVWKRVKDPQGLPEQDASVFVKSRRTLQEDLNHNKDLLQKVSMCMFDDRMFIVNEDDPGHRHGEELALNQAIGKNNYKNPLIAKVAEYVAPGLEMLKVVLMMARSVYNLFTWRDPYLTSLFLFGAVILLCVLLVFPWRLFFFVIGLGAVGPQNWLLRVTGKLPKKKKSKENAFKMSEKKSKKRSPKDDNVASRNFQFHSHLATDAGYDKRGKRSDKSTTSVHRAVVPNSPLMSRRFYDWPPNLPLSKVDIYSE